MRQRFGVQCTDAFVMLIENVFGTESHRRRNGERTMESKTMALAVCQFHLLSLFEAVEITGAESNVRASVYLRHLLFERSDEVIDAASNTAMRNTRKSALV